MEQDRDRGPDADKLASAEEGGRYGTASPNRPRMPLEDRGFKERLLEEECSSADWGE